MSAADETFESLRARIRGRYAQLSPHLQRLARSALEDPNRFALQPITTIAAANAVQPSALIRFAKAFGYGGFSAMQQVFKLRLIEGASSVREQVYGAQAENRRSSADAMTVLAACIDDMTASLRRLKKDIDPKALAQAVDMLAAASHIYVAGLRRSRPVAAYLAYGLMRVERSCSVLDFDAGMAAQQVANMRAGDVLAAIAFTEYSAAVVDIVEEAHLRGIAVLAITDVPSSPLARHAKVAFCLDVDTTMSFRPISAPIALVQALVVTLGRAAADRSSG